MLQPPVSPDLPVGRAFMVNALGAGFLALMLMSVAIMLLDAF